MEKHDSLAKEVFPWVPKKAQEQDVQVVDVDLPWGIKEEEIQQGKVIGICLAEIERCWPYSIGMFAERFGWTPHSSDYSPELLERDNCNASKSIKIESNKSYI